MISIVEDKCDFCGSCVAVCPPDCIEVREASIEINDEECINCDLCVYICPIDVLEQADAK